MADRDEILKILNDNASKLFVKRILEPKKYPTLDLGDGQYATHKMAWAELDTPGGKKKYIAYPTVLFNGKELLDYGDDAIDEVLKSGDYISFDDPKRADWFTRSYKSVWGNE